MNWEHIMLIWGGIATVLWSFDQLLKIIAPLTTTKIDDNLADWLGNLLAKFAPKKTE